MCRSSEVSVDPERVGRLRLLLSERCQAETDISRRRSSEDRREAPLDRPGGGAAQWMSRVMTATHWWD